MKHTHAQLPFVQLDEVILTVSDGFTDWAASTVRRTDSDRIATAAFIVRACNAHDELVAALEVHEAINPTATGQVVLAKAKGE